MVSKMTKTAFAARQFGSEVRLWFSEFLEALGIERFQILYG